MYAAALDFNNLPVTTVKALVRSLLVTFAVLSSVVAAQEQLEFPALDMQKIALEDEFADSQNQPLRFAVRRQLKVSPASAGLWQREKDGTWLWQLPVSAAEAIHLNFGFARFDLPPSASLVIRSKASNETLGPYTQLDRPPHGQLWTPVLLGDSAVIELRVADNERQQVDLSLVHIGQGYRGFGRRAKHCKSGSCNTDVACLSASDPWNQPRRAVGAYTVNGVSTCSGSLLNNTANDRRMLFATATHCNVESDADAASMVVYWRYESPTCRVPGTSNNATPLPLPSSRTTQGLRWLASTPEPFEGVADATVRSDWTLVELTTPPSNNDFQLYWAGWDRRAPTSACSAPADASSTAGLCASIHHANVDEKRISFIETPMVRDDIDLALGVHWRAEWDPTPPRLPNISPMPQALPISITERGSSGSPLYDANRRMIGVLSGGSSGCGKAVELQNDQYGGLFHAWEGMGTATTRVKDYLDPLRTAPNAINGVESCNAPTASFNSSAFSGGAKAGETLTFTASASGGTGSGYSYTWDLDGDGTAERTTTSNSVQLAFPTAFSGQPSVKISDSSGCSVTVSRALDVAGPKLIANAGTATQICGNNDAMMNPGERWRLPVSLQNSGGAATAEGMRALFANGDASSSGLDIGPNSFGYRGTSRSSGSCGYNFIDLSSSSALALTASGTNATANDDGRTSVITLGGAGLRVYGTTYTQAVMSTNGYVSFAAGEGGGDYDNSCPGSIDRGSVGPRLNVLHDDLVVGTLSNAGLRYQYFASCPRAAEVGGAQACHVFQWENMQPYSSSGTASGDASFQAVVYASSGQVAYQYRRADPNSGGGATIGLIDAGASDPINASCNTASAGNQQAFCLFEPGNQPTVTTTQVRLETPTIALGSSVAAGASRNVNLDFQIPTTATCGSAVNLDYVAAASSGVSSAERKAILAGSVAAGSCSVVNNCPANVTSLTARQGFYNDFARTGSGLASFQYGAAQGAIWYTALADHTPTWYIASGPISDNLGRLTLSRFTNAGAPSGFNPQGVSAGQAWWAIVDADTQFFAWQFNDGRRGAELMDNTASAFTVGNPNHTQAWYNASEDGWGLGIESLSLPLEFFAVYLYDSAGNARWLSGASDTLGNGTVSVSAQRPHCPGCLRYVDWDTRALPAGTLSRTYNGNTQATLNTAITLPAPLSGVWNRSNLTITTLGNPTP